MDVSLRDAVGGALEDNLAELLQQRLYQEVAVPAPAAGAEWSVTVPNVSAWELVGVHYVLTTSAVVATRTPTVVVRDGSGTRIARYNMSGGPGASSSVEDTYEPGLVSQTAGSARVFPLPTPPKLLLPQWSIGSLTSSLDVADQYSAVVLLVREWTFEELVRAGEWVARHTPQPAQ